MKPGKVEDMTEEMGLGNQVVLIFKKEYEPKYAANSDKADLLSCMLSGKTLS